MATRTIKLIGKAYAESGDVSLVVNFNGSEVFNGTVSTTAGIAPLKGEAGIELASWDFDTGVTGAIPLSIAVSGGTFQFNNLTGNYIQYVDPDADPLVADTTTFGDLNENTEASDGKTNIAFSSTDGDTPQRSIEEVSETEGEWVYTIKDGITFTCDFTISSDYTVS